MRTLLSNPASFKKPQLLQRMLMLAFCLIGMGIGKAQTISIGNLVISDSLELNSIADVSFNVVNTSDSTSILGNMKLNFMNETSQSATFPLGGFDAMQFFAPQQERTFSTTIPVTPQFFLEGGNTVVIWPSFVGQPVQSADSIRLSIYVFNINGIDKDKNEAAAYLVPNPMKSMLSIQTIGKAPLPEYIVVRELSGRLLMKHSLMGNGQVSISQVPAGIYLLEMHLPDGNFITQRIVRIAD
ncbi:MAG: hypothetical protein RLZZ543_1466 [Bacteroidota bacterium]